jgi:dynein light intermediate chain 1, cytosolic
MVDDRNSNKENLWSKILTEVQQHNIKTLPVRKNIVVLGNHGCGKTSLIAGLQNTTEIKCGVGLEYHYLDVKDERLDTTSKLGIWVLDGDPYHSNLLKFALNEESFAHTMILLMVSVTEPWYLLDSLQQWIEVVEKHVMRLKLTPEDRERWQRSLVRHFQMYEEPTEEEESKVDGVDPNAPNKPKDTTVTSSKPRHKAALNPLHPEEEDVHDSNKEANSGDVINLPLPEGVLGSNLGIPMIIVVNKTDYMDVLEREQTTRMNISILCKFIYENCVCHTVQPWCTRQ